MNLRILRGGCKGDSVVYESSAKRGSDPVAPSSLPSGDYGFEASALDQDSKTVAFVCTERTLPGDGAVALELTSQTGACDVASDGGESPPPDDDAGDAGGSDDGCGDFDADGCDDCSYTSTPDASRDGPERDDDGLCDCVVFADASIVGSGDGKRWSTAFSSLQAAVDRAAELGEDCEVWIRQGTYYGYTSAATDGLKMARGIELYGGFEGGELRRDQRSGDASLTVLDGRSQDSSAQRVAHVVIGADDTLLDGLTLVGGDAAFTADDGKGGAMLNVDADVVVRNVVFRTNHAALAGGALYNLRSIVVLDRCVFEANSSDASGGAISQEEGELSIFRSQFRDNQAGDTQFGGGALYALNANARFENSLIVNNSAVRYGGAVLVEASSAELVNCTVANNEAAEGGVTAINGATVRLRNSIAHANGAESLRAVSGSSFDVAYCDIQGGFAGSGNMSGNPRFVDPAAGDYHLTDASPCVDAADGNEAPPEDLEGRGRVDSPEADVGTGTPSYADMGCYEFLP